MDDSEHRLWAMENAEMHMFYGFKWYNPVTWLSRQAKFNDAAGERYRQVALAPGPFDRATFQCLHDQTSKTMRCGEYSIDALKVCNFVGE
jgi:hypothetical protein